MSMIACAVEGCKHQDIRKTDTILYRVTPKGTPFTGMCEKHYVEYVEAAALTPGDTDER